MNDFARRDVFADPPLDIASTFFILFAIFLEYSTCLIVFLKNVKLDLIVFLDAKPGSLSRPAAFLISLIVKTCVIYGIGCSFLLGSTLFFDFCHVKLQLGL